MDITSICVLGGSGFVGRHLCHQLAARGYRVRVPARDRERAKDLILLPTVDVVSASVHDARMLGSVIAGCDAVVNLVGVLHDRRGEGGFAAAHIELARKVVAACREQGVRRLLHMSALAAAPAAPSAYLRSKAEAEAIVRDSALEVTIMRPSVIFGPDDSFLNLFATLLRFFPVMLLGSPAARFQPVYIEDVASVMVRSLEDLSSVGKSYDLCGPKVYTLRELVEYVGRTTGRPRRVVGLGDALSYLQAMAMELSPVKLLTRDNYRSMQVASVCDCEFPFGMAPAALEVVAPAWLAARTPRARYQRLRTSARR